MDKYTLKFAYEKSFLGVIWRIELDETNGLLAVETRDPETGIPAFSTLSYTTGEVFLEELPYGGRDWTMAGIAKGKIILRTYGSNSPEGTGISCIQADTGEIAWEHFNYILSAFKDNHLVVRHRMYSSGHEEFMEIDGGRIVQAVDKTTKPPQKNIVIPIRQTGELPGYLKNYSVYGDLFVCSEGEKLIWAFHEQIHQKYQVRLLVSNNLDVLAEEIILTDLEKMVPEIYFKIDDRLFFIANNKKKIVSYLV